MNERYNIAIVCGSLTQGGGGRYAYELCRAIDKTRFRVDLLTMAPWGVKREFYGEPIRGLGVRIRPILPLFYFRRLSPLMRSPALAVQGVYRSLLLPRLMAKYDLIAALSLDYFLDVAFMLPRRSTVVVHLLNHLHQYSYNRYLEWPRDRPGLFICLHRSQEQEVSASLGNMIAKKVIIPPPIDLSEFPPMTGPPHPHRLVIGCFLRIDKDKNPLALLRTFARMKSRGAKIRFYGQGDTSTLRAEANKLGISEHVTFCGHASDIPSAIVNDGVTFVWQTAYDDYLGYTGVEMALLAVPTFFYNVGTGRPAASILEQSGGAIHCYSTEAELAEATLAVWKHPERVQEIAGKLRTFVQKRHDSRRTVAQIESFYEDAIQSGRGSSSPPDDRTVESSAAGLEDSHPMTSWS